MKTKLGGLFALLIVAMSAGTAHAGVLGDLGQLYDAYGARLAVVGILFGIASCFFGYKIFKIILGLLGLIIGLIIGATIGGAAGHGEGATVIGALIGGFVGAALAVSLFYLGVFLIGAAFGGLVAGMLSGAAGASSTTLILIGAFIGGVLAMVAQKAIIIISTAFSGSWNIVAGVAALTGATVSPFSILIGQRGAGSLALVMIFWIILGAVGAVFQYKKFGHEPLRKGRPSSPARVETPPL
jgi:hypothetical protein